MGVDVAIPLFEETVEWAGAINSMLMDNPTLYGQSLLLRDKALMKRRAQLGASAWASSRKPTSATT